MTVPASSPRPAASSSIAPSALERRSWIARLATAAVVGVVIGAVLGGLALVVLSTKTTATALIRIIQPADLTAIAGGAAQTTPNTPGQPRPVRRR